jgi:uncharacterized protein (TIGR02246 family)
MNDLDRLVALQEIRDVIARYAIHYDDKDWDAFATLWADEAAFVADGVAFEGKQTLLDFLTTCLPDDYAGKHMNSPPLVELDPGGETATGRTDVVWIAESFENQIVARYHDTFVKRGGRWLFLRREEVVVRFTPGPPPMSEAAMSVSSRSMRR